MVVTVVSADVGHKVGLVVVVDMLDVSTDAVLAVSA